MILHNSFKFNGNAKFDFNGGDLSSDGGLLLVHQFAESSGFNRMLAKSFHLENDHAIRKHSNQKLLRETIYLNSLGYHNQDHTDDLRNDPMLLSCFNNHPLASQPTHSRFVSRLTEETENQLAAANLSTAHRYLSHKVSEYLILDLDTTHFMAYGNQEGNAFNNHYRETGMSGLLLFEGQNGLVIKGDIRPGNYYCSKEAAKFLEPVLKDFQKGFASTCRLVRCDSVFASPGITRSVRKQVRIL